MTTTKNDTTTHNEMFAMTFKRGRKATTLQRFAPGMSEAKADAGRLAAVGGDLAGWSVVSVTHVATLVRFS